MTSPHLALSQRAQAPARSLADVTILCNPQFPLDAEEDEKLRQDLAPIRGGDRLGKVVRAIRRAKDTPTVHLLTGHIGGGKTTELRRLQKRLGEKDSDGGPLVTLFVDAEDLLHPSDVDLEEILVALWKVIADTNPTAAAEVLGPIWKNSIKKALTKSLVNLPDDVANLIDVLKQIRLATPEARREIRGLIAPFSSVLIDGLNKAFDKLRRMEDGEIRNVVVIIDNLEKLGGTREHVERLYLERLPTLQPLQAHRIITVPIHIAFSAAGGALKAVFGGDVVMLPMVKVHYPASIENGGDYTPGMDALVALLERRVDFASLFADGRGAAQTAARMSGGCIRHALAIVKDAAEETERAPVLHESLERAIAMLRADFERGLPEKWLPWLCHVKRFNGFPDDIPIEEKRDMLRLLYVLEYQNTDPTPWHDVHPLVATCRKFKDAFGKATS